MLFNSYIFLLAFLPVTVAGYYALGRRHRDAAAAWLAACSLFFYGWWDWRYVALLAGSIAFNYLAGARLGALALTARGKALLAAAVAANLALLGYFKYADFFIDSFNRAAGAQLPLLHVVLPLGISFFTFTQIAFLVDTWRGLATEYRFVHYTLFVTYFPHLIAGPVLHHKEMMPQFDMARNYVPRIRNFEVGLAIFVIGLAKKVLVADNLAPYAGALFDGPGETSLFVAWGGVLAYTFQLYFDFSGYSDMAIGLSRLFGVRLPLNFASPYKAPNVIEFWRRWHMTLSRFLRDYLYFPLGGNRHGKLRRHVNLMATMLLGGLWHGAGWSFVIWGGLHGIYLVVNHAWQAWRAPRARPASRAGRALAVAITFLFVTLAWVFFRAPDVETARRILTGMFGFHGVALPASLVNRLPALQTVVDHLGWATFLGGTSRFIGNWVWVVAAALVAFAAPNTQEWTRRFGPALDATFAPRPRSAPVWRPSPAWAIVMGLVAGGALLSMSRPSEFLYFQF